MGSLADEDMALLGRGIGDLVEVVVARSGVTHAAAWEAVRDMAERRGLVALVGGVMAAAEDLSFWYAPPGEVSPVVPAIVDDTDAGGATASIGYNTDPPARVSPVVSDPPPAEGSWRDRPPLL